MRVRSVVVAAAACGLFALSGCQFLEKDEPAAAPTPATSTSTTTTPSAKASGKASGKDNGGNASTAGFKNPCLLLSRAEVTTIAGGKAVTQVDEDGEKDGAAVRYCQWQLAGGQLAVFLTRTTESDFGTAHGRQQKVTGVGDDARFADGHLYVLHGDVQIDAYARVSGKEGASLQMAKNAALKVIDRL